MTEQSSHETRVFVGRAHDATTRICFGRADRRYSVRGGALHVFGPGRVVGYTMGGARAARCYVFRTGCDLRAGTTQRLVGVSPGVVVLIAAVGQHRCNRIVRILKVIERVHSARDDLSDMFFLRAGAARDRYTTLEQTIRALLREEHAVTSGANVRRDRRLALARVSVAQ